MNKCINNRLDRWMSGPENLKIDNVEAVGLLCHRLILEKQYQGHFVSIPEYNNFNEQASDTFLKKIKSMYELYKDFMRESALMRIIMHKNQVPRLLVKRCVQLKEEDFLSTRLSIYLQDNISWTRAILSEAPQRTNLYRT